MAIRAQAPDDERLMVAGIMFFFFVVGPVGVRWYAGVEPFGPVFGVSYLLLLALLAVVGAGIGIFAGYGSGHAVRAIVFGSTCAVLAALMTEAYLSARTTVFVVEFGFLAMALCAAVAFAWTRMDRRLVTGSGRRVVVSVGHPWASGVLGTVAEPPVLVREASKGWQGATRVVQPRHAKLSYTWVTFDEPLGHDLEKGPYIGAEIAEIMLSPAPPGSPAPPERALKARGVVWTEGKRKRLKLEFKAYGRS